MQRVNLSPFPHFLSISSSFPHSLFISSQPGCKAATIRAALVWGSTVKIAKALKIQRLLCNIIFQQGNCDFFGSTKCPALPSVHSMTMTKKTQNVQNDKNQDNAVTMIPYDLEEVQDDDDDFILRLSHAPRPAHISGDPLSGQTTLILVIILGCTLPTTWFLL